VALTFSAVGQKREGIFLSYTKNGPSCGRNQGLMRNIMSHRAKAGEYCEKLHRNYAVQSPVLVVFTLGFWPN
jgi:hypothetical protein